MEHIPCDVRTIKKIPTPPQVITLGVGEYCHMGLKNELVEFFDRKKISEGTFNIDINIDGVPIAKSSNST
jgi:hypothetical protein